MIIFDGVIMVETINNKELVNVKGDTRDVGIKKRTLLYYLCKEYNLVM